MLRATETGEGFNDDRYLNAPRVPPFAEWWDPSGIKRGRYYKRWNQDATGIEILCDEETGTVYFRWWYS